MQSYSTLRLLAEDLVARDFSVLRFDYDGTGDSAGSDLDPGRVSAWMASVAEAVSLVRRSGATSIALVGMRLGALFAGLAAEQDGDIDALVLWDPVVSGRTYVAEQRALGALSFNPTVPSASGTVEAPGMTFYSSTVSDLRALDLSKSSGLLAGRALVLTRSDRSPSPLASRLDMPHVEWREAIGQVDLMEAGSDYGAIAYGSIETVGTWVADTFTTSASPIIVGAGGGPTVVARTATGTSVVETPMFLGDTGLFGILTEATDSTTRTTALLLNVAHGNRIGPDRMWVDLARQWAAAGMRCFRMDHSGLGDSPTRHPAQPRFVIRAAEAFDDVAEACEALQPGDPSNVVLVGQCTSAYQALESAFDISPRGVVVLNPVTTFRPPEKSRGRGIDPRRRIIVPRQALIAAYYASHYRQPSSSGRLHKDSDLGRWLRAIAAPRNEMARWLRESLRKLSNVVSWQFHMLVAPARKPSSWLQDLVDKGIDVFAVCAKNDVHYMLWGVSSSHVEKLRHSGRFHLNYLPELEHAHFTSDRRSLLAGMMTEHVISRFGTGPGSGATSTGGPELARHSGFTPSKEQVTSHHE